MEGRKRARPLTEEETDMLVQAQEDLSQEMASVGLYFFKWTAIGLGAGVAATMAVRLRGGMAYVPMLALGSLGSIADFALAHTATNPLRAKLKTVTLAIRDPASMPAREEAVRAGFLPESALETAGEEERG